MRFLCSTFSVLLTLSSLSAGESMIQMQRSRPAQSEYQAKDYSYLFGMAGFSDALLKLHFQLYQGYVKNSNLLLARLKELEQQDKELSYDYGALKRRVAWEYNGMRLHEYYFDGFGGSEPLDKASELYQKLSKDFGSYEAWKRNFIATGMMRGIGWVILYRDLQTGRLFNTWINEHDLGHLAGGEPLLVMDVFEHAYITQYGLDRGKYITSFFENIDWEKINKRFTHS